MKKATIVLGALAAIALVLGSGDFGGLPNASDRKSYRKRCHHYNGRRFVYPEKLATPGLAEDVRRSAKGTSPSGELPVYAPFITETDVEKISVTWFGHSSLLLQMHGLVLLFDPMFSERSSPFQWIGPRRFSRPSVRIKDLPHIDAVLFSHDHYDHLDRQTVRQLCSKTDRFIVSLGVEKHLERWNVPAEKIISLAWWESLNIGGLDIACTPSRHFSGRGLFGQNSTQWCSWVLRDGYHSVFNSCDGSFGAHFDAIHKRFGGFDLAFMECGQYNRNWHYSHLYPEESVMAAEIIGAKRVMPIHWGAFSLSNHGWDDGPERFADEAEKRGISVIAPHICETFDLDAPTVLTRWWKAYK